MKKKYILLICLIIIIILFLTIKFTLNSCKCECKCDKDENVKSDEEIKSEKFLELNNILINYMDEVYNNDEWMNGGIDSGKYLITLSEFKQKGKDISMFVNPITGEQCDLEETYGQFIILGETEEGKTDFTYRTFVSCEREESN